MAQKISGALTGLRTLHMCSDLLFSVRNMDYRALVLLAELSEVLLSDQAQPKVQPKRAAKRAPAQVQVKHRKTRKPNSLHKLGDPPWESPRLVIPRALTMTHHLRAIYY